MGKDRSYYKNKVENGLSVGGAVALTPPRSADALQSSTAMTIVDLMCEGPIEGLVKRDGSRARGFSLLESIYLNNVQVKNASDYKYDTKKIKGADVQYISGISEDSIIKCLNNISGNMNTAKNGVSNLAEEFFTDEYNKIRDFSGVFTDLIKKSPETFRHLGVIQFSSNGMWSNSDNEFFRINFSGTNKYLHSYTSFDGLYGDQLIERSVEMENGNVIKIPESISFVSPVIQTTSETDLNADDYSEGLVGSLYKVSDFAGGGMMFFYMGETDSRVNGEFNTGKFMLASDDASFQTNKLAAIAGNYDFISKDTNQVSIYSATQSQVNPNLGDINRIPLKFGFTTDLSGQYNYNNVSFDFRKGYENQTVLAANSANRRDINYSTNLLGPFAQEFNRDVRAGGDFAQWNLTPVLQHDAYPVTHIINDHNVDTCDVTISVNSLFNTLSDGDDAGKQIPHTVSLRSHAGYELADGLVAGTPASLSEDGVQISVVSFVFLRVSDTVQGSANFLKCDGIFSTDKTHEVLGVNDDGEVISNFLGNVGNTVKLRNQNNGNLDTVQFGSDMSPYGLTRFDIGKVFVIPTEFSLGNTIQNYTEIPFVFTANGAFLEPEWSTILSVPENGGQVTLNSNYTNGTYSNGLLLGTTFLNINDTAGRYLYTQFKAPLFTISADPPTKSYTSNSQFQSLREALEAGVSLQNYVLSLYTSYEYVRIHGLSNSPYNTTLTSALTTNEDIRTKSINEQRDWFTNNFNTILYGYDTNYKCAKIPQNKDLKNIKNINIVGMTADIREEFGLGGENDLVFPGNTWKTPKRYLTVEKTTFETESVLKSANLYVNYFTEKINQGFTYPYSALVSTTVDARSMAAIPARSFDVRLKKIMVPSNYAPLRGDGTDKRFVSNSKGYGLRKIYSFDGQQRFGTMSPINLGTDNVEFSFKYKPTNFSQSYQTIIYGRHRNDNGTNVEGISVYFRNTSDAYAGSFDIRYRGASTHRVFTKINSSYLSTSFMYEVTIKITQTQLSAVCVVKRISDGVIVETVDGAINSSFPNPKTITRTNKAINMNALGTFANVNGGFFYIGAQYNRNNRTSSGSQIADVKIKKNNQLIHHWDGTLIDDVSGPDFTNQSLFFDKFGNHAKSFNTHDTTVQDTDFVFGKNKEQIYIGDWDGSFKIAWSDNPAWILYDMVINPIYGIGNRIDSRDDMNIFQLYELGKYCDGVDSDGFFDGVPDSQGGLEPRFSCNLLLSKAQNAYNVMSNISSIFRAINFWDGSHFSFSADRPKEIAAIFNNGNVFDGRFEYGDVVSSSRFNRVEVPYADATDDYVLKSEYVEDEESIRKYGLINKVYNGIGCTSKSQAKRAGKYILLSNKLETEIVNFQAGQETLMITPGDIIRIDDELKNFEINYGKILEIDYDNNKIKIDKSIEKDSIVIGSNGGLYTYNNKEQNEIKDLYDIYNFDLTRNFGLDSDEYVGKIPSEEMQRIEAKQISKFNIASVTELDTQYELTLSANTDITGVMTGANFNLQLSNNVNQTYKVLSVTAGEQEGLYNINALEYKLEKFSITESEDYDTESNNFSIDEPTHSVNRPTPPNGFSVSITQQLNGSYTVAGNISAGGGATETSYRVAVVRKDIAGPYYHQEFRKEVDGTTAYSIEGLSAGTYSVSVTSLRNPESSEILEQSVYIPNKDIVYNKNLIKNITLETSNENTYYRTGGFGYGYGTSLTDDLDFNFNIKDQFNNDIDLSDSQFSLNIYAKNKLEDLIIMNSGYKSNEYHFTNVDNELLFGSITGVVEFKFELLNDNRIEDTANYTGYISQ